ncbi:hypothetical protein KQX54_006630 [Cotesia glomerata]|uniref:Uncharacterized protein n=1 Tax=Cotesia glomerata TaxID=32391 RepID=A0AAV7I4J4_COTGL|nr:hypothetical protein KQX54_006630 [Cotesia glomerata]
MLGIEGSINSADPTLVMRDVLMFQIHIQGWHQPRITGINFFSGILILSDSTNSKHAGSSILASKATNHLIEK